MFFFFNTKKKKKPMFLPRLQKWSTKLDQLPSLEYLWGWESNPLREPLLDSFFMLTIGLSLSKTSNITMSNDPHHDGLLLNCIKACSNENCGIGCLMIQDIAWRYHVVRGDMHDMIYGCWIGFFVPTTICNLLLLTFYHRYRGYSI